MGGAVIAGFALVVVTILAFPRETTEPSVPPSPRATEGTSASTTSSTPAPDVTMPPAWLAWIAGSLPEDLAARASAIPEMGDVVVVAGDTRWMTESHDADGEVVDRPPRRTGSRSTRSPSMRTRTHRSSRRPIGQLSSKRFATAER